MCPPKTLKKMTWYDTDHGVGGTNGDEMDSKLTLITRNIAKRQVSETTQDKGVFLFLHILNEIL